ncbi:hypothetical protein GOODEAATRI_004105 [Goodea atripinnis]|uniref:Uncharacterized protein n=1 Tax=Goodea atripinnis TaxID=208336 RepID=A0ABV0N7P1_9TELE
MNSRDRTGKRMVTQMVQEGTWWYRSIRYSGDQILISTTQLFMHFMYKTPNMNMKRFHAPRLVTIENCMKLTQMIVQGLQESKSPLLQLPHFEEEHLRYCISKKEWEALQQSIQRRERALLETKSKVTHPVYSLYFPEEKQEWWWLYIADRKDQTLVSMPYHVCTLKDSEEVTVTVTIDPAVMLLLSSSSRTSKQKQ